MRIPPLSHTSCKQFIPMIFHTSPFAFGDRSLLEWVHLPFFKARLLLGTWCPHAFCIIHCLEEANRYWRMNLKVLQRLRLPLRAWMEQDMKTGYSQRSIKWIKALLRTGHSPSSARSIRTCPWPPPPPTAQTLALTEKYWWLRYFSLEPFIGKRPPRSIALAPKGIGQSVSLGHVVAFTLLCHPSTSSIRASCCLHLLRRSQVLVLLGVSRALIILPEQRTAWANWAGDHLKIL